MGSSLPATPPRALEMLFRRRVAAIGVAFALSAAFAFLLAPFPPFAGLVGVLSLPQAYLWSPTAFTSGGGAWVPAIDPTPLIVPAGFIVVGFWLRAWGTSYLSGAVMRDSEAHTERLIVAGPFRYVRNPLYLGNLFLAIGWGLVLPPPGVLVSFLLMLAVVLGLIRFEEGAFSSRHPEAFGRFASKVPRLVPRLRPAAVEGDSKPNWGNGFGSESGLLGMFLGIVVLPSWSFLGFVLWLLGLVASVAARWRKARA